MSATVKAPLHFPRTWTAVGLLLILAIVALSLLSVPGPPGPPGIDKVSHLVAYGSLMGWWGMVQPGRRWRWALMLLMLGLGLELAQSMTPYRTLDSWDMVANGLGVLLALILLRTPLGQLLGWLDRQLADRFNTGTL